MRTLLWMCLITVGAVAGAAEQQVLNKSDQQVDKVYERDAEFRVDDQSSLTGRVIAERDLKLWVNDRSKVRLEGSARRVIIKCAEGGSEVDLRAFECDEVIFENALTNNTTVYVSARNKVEFTEKIDDKSVAYVRSGGEVKGKTLKGNSRVFFSGATPQFKEVNGGGTAEARDW